VEVVTKIQRPSSCSFWARNARASAFTNAGSARGVTSAKPPAYAPP
jgi:hypothetical protein